MIRNGAFAVFLIASALVLSACGGEVTTQSVVGARDEIERVFHIADTATDPSVICRGIATQRYDEQITLTEGPAAVAACERQAASSSGETVDASRIEVNGERASADLTVDGGTFDGQTLRLELVQADGRWKFNEITEFVELDRLRLLKKIFISIPKELDRLPHAVVRCLLEEFAVSSQETIERVLFSGSVEPWRSLVGRCSQGGTLTIG